MLVGRTAVRLYTLNTQLSTLNMSVRHWQSRFRYTDLPAPSEFAPDELLATEWGLEAWMQGGYGPAGTSWPTIPAAFVLYCYASGTATTKEVRIRVNYPTSYVTVGSWETGQWRTLRIEFDDSLGQYGRYTYLLDGTAVYTQDALSPVSEPTSGTWGSLRAHANWQCGSSLVIAAEAGDYSRGLSGGTSVSDDFADGQLIGWQKSVFYNVDDPPFVEASGVVSYTWPASSLGARLLDQMIVEGLAVWLAPCTGHTFAYHLTGDGLQLQRGECVSGLPYTVTDNRHDRPIAALDLGGHHLVFFSRAGTAFCARSYHDGRTWSEDDMAAIPAWSGYELLDVELCCDGLTLLALLWDDDADALCISRCTNASGTNWTAPAQIAAGLTNKPVARLREYDDGLVRAFYQIGTQDMQVISNEQAGIEGEWS